MNPISYLTFNLILSSNNKGNTNIKTKSGFSKFEKPDWRYIFK